MARSSKRRTPPRRSSGSKRPLISVVIPTFNRAAMLSATLESVAAQSISKYRYEVVVVDDGSKDTTADVCRDFAARIQLSHRYIDNSGISAAKNTGIMASRGKILLFFDDDDVADFHLLEEHIKAHERHPQENIAVLGYTTWAPTLSVTPLMRYVTEIGRFLFAYGDLKDGQILDFTYFWGGRSSCKRSFLAKHGVFNRQFHFGSEDVELGYRLSKFGFQVVFHRAAISYMTRAPTFEEFCDRCERQGETLFLLSRLHDDPVLQQYCQCADPFIENCAVGVDPEARWPEVAALFQEKVDELGRVERLLAWGFEPEVTSGAKESKQLARAEAYRLQMRELFAKCSELERLLSERAATHQAELAKLDKTMGELAKANDDLRERFAKANSQHQIEVQQLRHSVTQINSQHQIEVQQLRDRVTQINSQHQIEVQQLRDRVTQINSQHQIEVQQLRHSVTETNRLLHNTSISLSEQERRGAELTDRVRKQLWSTRKLSRLLDDAEKAAARLRSS